MTDITQPEMESMCEALRSQGLTWNQVNFAVSLFRNHRAGAVAPAQGATGWQPMDTAPKDKRIFLLEAGRVFQGSWLEVPFHEVRDEDGRYIDQQDEDAYWMDHEDGDRRNPEAWQPDVWPAAPDQPAAQPHAPAPMSDDRIDELLVEHMGIDVDDDAGNAFARAVLAEPQLPAQESPAGRSLAEMAAEYAGRSDVVRDAWRLRWLCDDHDSQSARDAVQSICDSIPARSIGAVRADIDAAMAAQGTEGGA